MVLWDTQTRLKHTPRRCAGRPWRMPRLALYGCVVALMHVGAGVLLADDAPPVASDEETLPCDDALGDIDLLALKVPVVVTASRHKQRITDVPYAISVVSAEEIRLSGARSIADALRLAPGVDVAELAYGLQAASPRGFHGLLSNQTLVLVDGRQIFDAMFGGTLWGSWPVPLEDIERIEVIRGPGGVTWGANAANGVINVITKDPSEQVGFVGVTRGGSRGTAYQYLSYAGVDKNLRYRLSMRYEQSDGYSRWDGGWGTPEDDYRGASLNACVVYEPSEARVLTFSAASGAVDGGVPAQTLGRFSGATNPGSEASHIMMHWSEQLAEDSQLDMTAYVNDFRFSSGVPMIDYRYQQVAMHVGHTFAPARAHSLTWGIDTRLDFVDTHQADPYMLTRPRVRSGMVGVYLQDRWALAPHWWLDMAGRVDYDRYGGIEPSARLALSHELSDDVLVYGAVSRAFQRIPGALQFVRIPYLGGLVNITSTDNDTPQKVIAYELGSRARLSDRAQVSAVLFWHEYDDLTTLSMELGPPGLLRIHNESRAKASTYGLEIDAECELSERVSLHANYTFERMDWRSHVDFRDEDYMTMPEHKCMIGAVCSPTDDWHLSAHAYYVGEVLAPDYVNPIAVYNIDDYVRVDVRSEHEFKDDSVALAIGVRNLLDAHHYEGMTSFADATQVPRIVYAELRVHLR